MMDKLVNLIEYSSSLEAAEITTLLDENGIAYILETKDSTGLGLKESVMVKIYSSDMEEAKSLLGEVNHPDSISNTPSRYRKNAFNKDEDDNDFNNRFQYTFERYHPTEQYAADPDSYVESNPRESDGNEHTDEKKEQNQAQEDSKSKLEDVVKKYLARPIIAYIIIKIIFSLMK